MDFDVKGIYISDMIGSFASSAMASLVVKNRKKMIPLLEIRSSKKTHIKKFIKQAPQK